MPFDAGSIRGTLTLDTTQFKQGFSEAHSHADTEGGAIREIAESIAEVFSEAVGPAIGGVASQLQSLAAGFSEGPAIGFANAMAIGFATVREAAERANERIEEISLTSEKLGVSTEYLSKMAAAGEVVKVSTESLGAALNMLNFHIGEVAEGADKKGVTAFDALKISQDDLKAHLSDTAWVIDTVIDRIEKMGLSAAQRAPILREILGRGGNNLMPLFGMGDDIKKIGDFAQDVGAVVVESNEKSAHSFAMLREEVKLTLDGMAMRATSGIFSYIEEHHQAIEDDLKIIADDFKIFIPDAIKFIDDLWKGFMANVHKDMDTIKLYMDATHTGGAEAAAHGDVKVLGQVVLESVGPHGRVDPEKMGPIDAWILDPIATHAIDDGLSSFNVPGAHTIPNWGDAAGAYFPPLWNPSSMPPASNSAGPSMLGGSISASTVATLGPDIIAPLSSAMGAAFLTAMDSHAASHANSGVGDVLMDALNSAGLSTNSSGGGAAAGGKGPGGSSAGGPTYNIYVQGTVTPQDSSSEIGRRVRAAFDQMSRNSQSDANGRQQHAAAKDSLGGQ